MENRSFTLIELLVVIAVIGLIASIILVNMKSAREKAKVSKMEDDLFQIRNAIDIARHKEDKVLLQITGSGCSACSCWSADCDYKCDACRTRMDTTFKRLGLPGAIVDPWGRYYGIDENELEFADNPCRKDTIICAHHKTISVPFYSPQCLQQ